MDCSNHNVDKMNYIQAEIERLYHSIQHLGWWSGNWFQGRRSPIIWDSCRISYKKRKILLPLIEKLLKENYIKYTLEDVRIEIRDPRNPF